MKTGIEKLILTNGGDINKLLGTEITKLNGKIIKNTQSFMIDIILSFQNTYKNNYGMDTSVKSTPVDKHILHKYFYEKQRKEK